MKNPIILLIAFMAIFCHQHLVAHSHKSAHTDSVVSTTRIFKLDADSSRVVSLHNNAEMTAEQDSLRNLVYAFYYDQFRHSQDPEAPTFLFMSKSANMLMGIGGVVRMRGWYDWGGAIPSNGFMPYLIPIPEDPANTRKFSTTPAGTTLFFQMIGRSKAGSYRLYIEANFNGYEHRGFNLKKAYATLGDFTIGLTNSTFSDPSADVPTVDAQGATNKLTKTDVLVRYMHTFHDRWGFAVSLENPTQQIDLTTGITGKSSNWLPDVAAFIQYQWSNDEHLRLSGLVRTLSYRDLIGQRNHAVAGWALQLSSIAHPHPQVTTYFTANYGHGYSSQVNDLLASNYDLISNPDIQGLMYAPRAFGYCLGLQYNFTPAIFTSVSFSQTHLSPSYSLTGNEYRRGWCTTINIFWNILPRFQVAAEFDFGCRHNVGGEYRYARRIGALCQFSF